MKRYTKLKETVICPICGGYKSGCSFCRGEGIVKREKYTELMKFASSVMFGIPLTLCGKKHSVNLRGLLNLMEEGRLSKGKVLELIAYRIQQAESVKE